MVGMLKRSRAAFPTAAILAFFVFGSNVAQGQLAGRTTTHSDELRVAVVSNSVLAIRQLDGQVSGLAVDLGNALAAKRQSNLKVVPYDNIVRFNQSIGKDDWDIAFVPRDLSRTSQLVFSDVWLEVDNAYVARPGISFRTSDEVDRAGTKVAVSQGSPLDGALSRTLKYAEVVRIPGGLVEAREALAYRRADVVADAMPVAYRIAAELPGATVLVGRFNAIRMVIAVPKKDDAALPEFNEFLRNAKQSGVIAEAIKKANLRGVRSPR